MAWMDIDEESGYITVDLHDFATREAIAVANQKVREAWENGFRWIELVHGAPDSEYAFQAWSGDRGSIKWSLRGALTNGEWMEYAYNRRSVKHDVREGTMVLALRPNPSPRTPPTWEPLPEAQYAGQRRRRY